MKFVNRIKQPFFYLMILLTIITYCLIFLVSWPIYFICGLFWREKDFRRVHSMLHHYLPSLPSKPFEDTEKENEEKMEELKREIMNILETNRKN